MRPYFRGTHIETGQGENPNSEADAIDLAQGDIYGKIEFDSSPPSKTVRSTRPGLNLDRHHGTQKRGIQAIARPDRRGDPLGLIVLSEPLQVPKVDIIFVHGLGGSSRQTWAKNRNLELFWPEKWLPREPEFAAARISSFGYNAHFASISNTKSILNISDFAKDLLFSMKFAKFEQHVSVPMGSIPIVFVAHSMGGLVVKKAVILAQNDAHYRDLFNSILGITFLSTPHRGTHLAALLNKLLSACLFTFSPKQYVAELNANSPTLQELNELFRHLAPKMSIVSFYETLPTSVGPLKMMVLQKESSTLGYPGEILKSLDADHHDVAKYTGPQDPNYISVKSILAHLITNSYPNDVASIIAPLSIDPPDELQELQNMIGDMGNMFDDLDYFGEKTYPTSCEWMFRNPVFINLIDADANDSRILWCSGPPGFGKSVLAAYVTRRLQECSSNVLSYFFRHGDEVKNNLSMMQRVLAYQAATCFEDFRRRLLRILRTGFNLQNATSGAIWQKIFVESLFKLPRTEKLYLVIDGLDECDESTVLISRLASIAASSFPVAVLALSRNTPSLAASFDKLSKTLPLQSLYLGGIDVDLKLYVEEEMFSMSGADKFKSFVASQLISKADGNFLWLNLVLKEVLQCNTESEVLEALEGVPEDLEKLYLRIDSTLASTVRPSDRMLAQAILTWVSCSKRGLAIHELEEALRPEYSQLLNLRSTVGRLCGDFVVINQKEILSMVHATARKCLIQNSRLNFHVAPSPAHQLLLLKCLSALSAFDSRYSRGQAKLTSFLNYAATSWAFHLSMISEFEDPQTLVALAQFFKSRSVLTWISLLSISNELKVLIQASKSLISFVKATEKTEGNRSLLRGRIIAEDLLNAWAADLIRIIGKFGSQLVSSPKLILKLVPAFCPRDSVIHQQFASDPRRAGLTVFGMASTGWDDCVAKFVVSSKSLLLAIKCVGRHLAITTSNGTVIIYYSETCEEARRLDHGERILAWAFNHSGDLMVTCSLSKTIVWTVATARQLYCIQSIGRIRPLAVTFADDDSAILICTDDRLIRRVILCTREDEPNTELNAFPMTSIVKQHNQIDNDLAWEILHGALGENAYEGRKLASPRCVAFDYSGKQVAITYREAPLSVWSLEEPYPSLIGRCRSSGASEEIQNKSASDIQDICWNPLTGHILGVIKDARCVFKWHPIDGDYSESSKIPNGSITCSSDGKFFVTSAHDGSLRVWDFHHFTIIYQLNCPEACTSLAVDPSDARIYDIRGSFCCVWQPNALVRLWEADDKSSETQSNHASSTQVSAITETSYNTLSPITSLSIDDNSLSCVVGNEEGFLTLMAVDGVENVTLTQVFMTVKNLCWSADGRFIACSDLARRASVISLLPADSNSPRKPVLVAKSSDPISQLQLSSEGEFLLIASERFVNIWSVTEQKLLSTRPQNQEYFWINHPHHSSQIIGFSPNNVQMASWEDPEMRKSIQIDANFHGRTENDSPSEWKVRRPSDFYPMSPSEVKTAIDKVMVTVDGSVALISISQSTKQRRRRKFMAINIDGLSAGHASTRPLSAELLDRMSLAIGFVTSEAMTIAGSQRRRSSAQSIQPQDHRRRPSGQPNSRVRAISPLPHRENILVFLDQEYWVCTYTMNETHSGAVKRHYFLPRDWLNMDCLELASVRADGTLLCPRNGELITVMHGLNEEWIE